MIRYLQEKRSPAGYIPAIQGLEYLRAFITGRMGWAQTGGLLIISGAFGAFRRRRILEIGGYLTGTGIYRKDTVGEDMELVVRLRRHLYEQGVPHKVEYVHTANCWTEIPSRLGGLMKQHDRWNRGACCAISLRTRDGRSWSDADFEHGGFCI
ncbi:MAG: glycosyltransferase [Spirochaeta sp.]